MEYFVLLVNATTVACEKFITVTFHNSAANNIVFDYSYYSCSLSLFVDVCVCVWGGAGVTLYLQFVTSNNYRNKLLLLYLL